MQSVYRAESSLILLIQTLQRKTWRRGFWSCMAIIAVIALQYVLRPMPLRPLIVFIILTSGVLGFSFYQQVNSLSRQLNKIVTEICFHDDEVYFRSTAIKTVFGITSASIEIKAGLSDLVIKPTEFPIKSLFGADDRILKVNYQSTQLFIVVKYFDSELESKFKNRP